MTKKIMALLGAMMALTVFSGCLQMETAIKLKKDGSGTIEETVNFTAQVYGMMKMAEGQEGAEDPLADFSEEKLKEKAAQYGEGVEFVSVNKEEKDGGLLIKSVFKFADINKVSYSPDSMMGGDEEEEAPEEKEKAKFVYKDGELTITFPELDNEDMGFDNEDMNEEQMAMMAPMMAGMKMVAKIVIEDGIEETNATYHEGNEIIMIGMEMDELAKNEGGMMAMKKLQGIDDRAKFGETIKDIKGLKMESKEKVTVKVK